VPRERRMLPAPIPLRKHLIQIAKRDSARDVGKRERIAMTERGGEVLICCETSDRREQVRLRRVPMR
jgi:hypothetical protein